MMWIRISTHQHHSIGSHLDLDFLTDSLREGEVFPWTCGRENAAISVVGEYRPQKLALYQFMYL